MSPNGLRRWRRYAKKCRYRSRKEGKVSNATGASLRALFFAARIHPNYAVPPKPLTARSLVGMTMGARKRRSRAVSYLVIVDVTFIEHAETWANTDHSKLFRQRKFPRHQWDLEQYNQVRAQYRIGERLRPCPGCFDCAVECWVCHEPHEPPDELCDGSGVIRAGKLRPLLRKSDCGFYID